MRGARLLLRLEGGNLDLRIKRRGEERLTDPTEENPKRTAKYVGADDTRLPTGRVASGTLSPTWCNQLATWLF